LSGAQQTLRTQRTQQSHTIQQPTSATERPESEEKLLSKLIEEYVEEKYVIEKMRAKTADQTRSRLNLMLEILGDKPANSFTRADFVELLKTLKRFPARRNIKPQYRDKTVAEILEMEIAEPLSKMSVKYYIEALSSMFKWAVANGDVDKNFASSLAPDASKKKKRKQFSPEHLQQIYDLFKPAPYKAVCEKDHNRSRKSSLEITEEDKWIVYIGMWQGMRCEEICHLYKNDIKQSDDGIWCFDINTEKGKQLKTESSERLIPIHPQLLELSFLSYCENLKHERLFPSLTPKKYGKVSSAKSKVINRRIDRFVIDDKKYCYHSLRHNFNDALKKSDVTEQYMAELSGRKTGSISMEDYSEKYPPRALFDILKKVDYKLDY
jgi:integrase